MPADAHVELQRLTVSYDGAPAVRDVDLSIGRNDAVGIVGPNGAGKSSLLNCVAGLVPAKPGRVLLGGRDVTSLPAWRRARLGVQLVPDGGGVFPDLSVETNLEVACRDDRAGRRDGVAQMFAAFPRLAERRAVAAGSLSGGEQRMLAVARALVRRPQLLILDESTVGLSWAMVDHLAELLRTERRVRPLTLLVAGEDLTFIKRVCDQVVFLEHGRLTETRPVADLGDPEVLQRVYFGTSSQES